MEWATRELAVLDHPEDAPPDGRLGCADELECCGASARRLLATWLGLNCRAGATAEALGMHRNTFAARLPVLGARLRLPLRDQGAAPYQALWLLVAAGHIPVTGIPDPTDPAA
ncbi:helix-turn-helix domain-containing protein [Streptomyces sp. G6]|uniref:helix-turn-helix domain-containing protein n=1 Tax=Streptomyces sp. G6 TaxID=1178736 RepID=UPI003ED93E10